jgi:hypothetical protein
LINDIRHVQCLAHQAAVPQGQQGSYFDQLGVGVTWGVPHTPDVENVYP